MTRKSTQERTKQVAMELIKRGEYPSANKVRDILEKGGMPQIQEGLKEFWIELGERINRYETAPGIPDIAFQSLKSFWELLVEESKKEFTEAKTQLEQELEELKKSSSELLTEKNDLISLLDQEKQVNVEIQDRLQKLSDDYASHKDKCSDEIQSLKQSKQDLLEKLERQQNEASFVINNLNLENEALKSQNDKLDARAAKQENLIDQLNEKIRETYDVYHALLKENKDVTTKLEIVYAEKDRLSKQIVDVQNLYDDVNKNFKETIASKTTLEFEIIQLKERIHFSNEQNEKLNEEIRSLQSTLRLITEQKTQIEIEALASKKALEILENQKKIQIDELR